MFEDEDRVLYKAWQKVQEVARSKVKEVRSVERYSLEFLNEYAALDLRSVSELMELAEWAEKHGLPGEARGLWLRAVMLDEQHAGAWEKLGGQRSKTKWALRLGNQSFGVNQFRSAGRDWKYAIEIPTAHFLSG